MEFKSNLLTIAIIAGFAILLGYFAWQFGTNSQETSQSIEQTSRETSKSVNTTVNQAAHNVTSAVDRMVDLKESEVDLLRNLSMILVEERQTNKENLELFLGTFANQSESEVNATKDLEDHVVDTLEMSQNLTQKNMKVLEERNNLLRLQSLQFDQLITLMGGNSSLSIKNITEDPSDVEEVGPLTFNLTLSPNATVLAPGA